MRDGRLDVLDLDHLEIPVRDQPLLDVAHDVVPPEKVTFEFKHFSNMSQEFHKPIEISELERVPAIIKRLLFLTRQLVKDLLKH